MVKNSFLCSCCHLKDKYKFLCKDLNNVNYNFIDNYIPNKADIIFLMSLGSWINNWRNLYEYSLTKGKQIILEVNNAKEGKEQLERVISHYPKDIELRFLRFCVQDGTPAILDYKLNMDEDSQFIKNNISTSSEELQQFIIPIFKILNDGRTSYTSR